MIKHGVVMVTLLILTLSLLGVVSASDVTASDVALSLNHEDTQISVAPDEYISASNVESSGSSFESSDSGFKSSDLKDIRASGDDVEEDIPIYLNSKTEIKIENKASDSCIDTELSSLAIGAGEESEVLICDVELLDDCENNSSVPIDVPSVGIGSDLSDENYKFGQEITASANEQSSFESADGILVLVEVGEDEIDNVTVENVLNGINDASNGYITYRKGNLIKLSSIESGLKNIAFFIKKGEFLTMVIYENGDITPIYSNKVGPQDSAGLWMILEELLSGDGASSSAKSLSSRLSEDILSSGENGYHDFAALTLEKSLIQTLLEYNLNDDTDLPLENTGKYIIGVSGDSEDNAFIWYAPDKSAYLGVDSNDNNMIGFNLEDNAFKSRMITEMSYDQTNIKEMYENSLNPEESVMLEIFNAAGDITPEFIKMLGVDAGLSALSYFSSQGIDIDKYYQNFYILTSAGSVRVGGLDTDNAIEGILEVFGDKFSKNLISVDTPLWKDLVFYFLWVSSPNSDDIVSYGLKYVYECNKLIESSQVRRQGDDIAYAMGLYGKHPAPAPEPPAHYPQKASYSYSAACEFALAGNNMANNTNITNNTNASGMNLSDIRKLESKKVNTTPVANRGSPYNILYNIAAIFIICVVFGASYSKR